MTVTSSIPYLLPGLLQMSSPLVHWIAQQFSDWLGITIRDTVIITMSTSRTAGMLMGLPLGLPESHSLCTSFIAKAGKPPSCYHLLTSRKSLHLILGPFLYLVTINMPELCSLKKKEVN